MKIPKSPRQASMPPGFERIAKLGYPQTEYCIRIPEKRDIRRMAPAAGGGGAVTEPGTMAS
jgi:hypothetical protein